MKTAFFAGSFDPFTLGHKSIVDRAFCVFNRIIIGVGVNSGKAGWLSPDDRVNRIRNVYADDARVEVIRFEGLTADAALDCGADALLRGVRSVTDFEYERQLADINRTLSGIETVLMYADPCMASISSSVVRELAAYGADITPYIP